MIIAVRVQGRTEDFPTVKRDVQRACVQRDQRVTDGLVHITVGVGIRGRSNGVQVCKGNDAVTVR